MINRRDIMNNIEPVLIFQGTKYLLKQENKSFRFKKKIATVEKREI